MDSTGYYLTGVVSIITERYRLRTRWIVFATASSLWARLGENTCRQARTKRKNGPDGLLVSQCLDMPGLLPEFSA